MAALTLLFGGHGPAGLGSGAGARGEVGMLLYAGVAGAGKKVRPRPVDGAAEVEARRRADLLRTAVGGRPAVRASVQVMVASVGSGVREPL
jgi:hypothetical protein